jgi:hypothetical protein
MLRRDPVSSGFGGDPVAVELHQVGRRGDQAPFGYGGGATAALEGLILRLNLICATTGSTVAFRCL